MEYTYKQEGGMRQPQPKRVHTVVVSVQHNEDITLEEMRTQIKEKIVKVTTIHTHPNTQHNTNRNTHIKHKHTHN